MVLKLMVLVVDVPDYVVDVSNFVADVSKFVVVVGDSVAVMVLMVTMSSVIHQLSRLPLFEVLDCNESN